MVGCTAAVGDVAEGGATVGGDDNDVTADGGGSEGCETMDEKDEELKLLIHPRSGRIVESEDDGTAADDDGGEGCATVGPLKLVFFTFFAGLVSAAEIFTFEAAAATVFASEAAALVLRAALASLYLCLQSKHVRRGFMVPFLICSHKYLSNPHVTRSSLWHPRHRIVGGTYAAGGGAVEIAAIEGCATAGSDDGTDEDDDGASSMRRRVAISRLRCPSSSVIFIW